jgi:transposase
VSYCNRHNNQNKTKPTIIKVSDSLWDRISNTLPSEKADNTIGRPAIPFRKVMDGIVYVLRTGCQWKMLPKEYSSGSTCHRRFQEWARMDVFKNMWIEILKEYDNKKGIKWMGNLSIAYP